MPDKLTGTLAQAGVIDLALLLYDNERNSSNLSEAKELVFGAGVIFMSETTKQQTVLGTNPIIGMDFPDPDVIFADGCFYMVSTTMHFFPGGEILRSYDLVHWEHAAYIYDELEGTKGQKLEDGENIYGKGMWAACIRQHKGQFYVAFSCNDTNKTYLFRSEKIEGPWTRSIVEGWYYDLSMLFDEDRVYMVHGHKEIFITELAPDLSGPKEGGLHRLLLSDKDNPVLGLEGSHIYKINGEYWLFNIHSLATEWRRVETAYHARKLEDEFVGGDVLNFALDDRPDGFAQGGVVEGPDGSWHAVLFRDNGAVGRIPVVVDVKWETEETVAAEAGAAKSTRVVFTAAKEFETTDFRPGYEYAPLYGSDDFTSPEIKNFWQFNHQPDLNLVKYGEGSFKITTGRISKDLENAKNTLTQRMHLPMSTGEVSIDGTELHDGDIAGLAAFQGQYCFVGITKEDGKYYAVMAERTEIKEKTEIEGPLLRVKLQAEFGEKDQAKCFWRRNGEWESIGPVHPLQFKLDHFTGCRFGLFCYSTKTCGGTAEFTDFVCD